MDANRSPAVSRAAAEDQANPAEYSRPILTIPRGPLVELRVSLEAYEGIYRGRPVLRCQLWRREDAVADWLPTRKCLSARIEEIPLLLTAFQEAAELLSPIYPELFEREDRPVQGEGLAR